MTAPTEPRWIADSLGNEHAVIGEGTKISEHETTRVHLSLCGVAVAERVPTARCPECAEAARRRGLRIEP